LADDGTITGDAVALAIAFENWSVDGHGMAPLSAAATPRRALVGLCWRHF
jgi:hypothetical protein